MATARDILTNKYVTASVSLFVIVYASLARPQLPGFVAALFDSAVFRVIFLTMLVYMSNQNLQISIMIALAFTITMNLLNEQKIAEGFIDGIKENMLNENFDDTQSKDSEESDE